MKEDKYDSLKNYKYLWASVIVVVIALIIYPNLFDTWTFWLGLFIANELIETGLTRDSQIHLAKKRGSEDKYPETVSMIVRVIISLVISAVIYGIDRFLFDTGIPWTMYLFIFNFLLTIFMRFIDRVESRKK